MGQARTYTVDGMSCQHCRNAVEREVLALDGVSGADVDLTAGTLTVVGAASDEEVRRAVDEAGYAVRA